MYIGLFAYYIFQILNAVGISDFLWDLIDKIVDLQVELHVLLQPTHSLAKSSHLLLQVLLSPFGQIEIYLEFLINPEAHLEKAFEIILIFRWRDLQATEIEGIALSEVLVRAQTIFMLDVADISIEQALLFCRDAGGSGITIEIKFYFELIIFIFELSNGLILFLYLLLDE
jgi:hypothetical protein